MNSRLGSVLLSLLMSASVMAGEYNLTVDRVEIDTGDFVKDGIGYNGASPGPVMRFKEGEKETWSLAAHHQSLASTLRKTKRLRRRLASHLLTKYIT